MSWGWGRKLAGFEGGKAQNSHFTSKLTKKTRKSLETPRDSPQNLVSIHKPLTAPQLSSRKVSKRVTRTPLCPNQRRETSVGAEKAVLL